ncbi:MAG: hypothetical protein WA941_08280 [Nitrososphaeraceae archaeon]
MIVVTAAIITTIVYTLEIWTSANKSTCATTNPTSSLEATPIPILNECFYLVGIPLQSLVPAIFVMAITVIMPPNPPELLELQRNDANKILIPRYNFQFC